MFLPAHRNGCAATHAFRELDFCIKRAVLAQGDILGEKCVPPPIPRAEGERFTAGHFHFAVGQITHVALEPHDVTRLINEAVGK